MTQDQQQPESSDAHTGMPQAAQLTPAPITVDPEAPYLGHVIDDRYQLTALIGKGGWGNVYRGKHLVLGTEIAVKVLHSHIAQDEDQCRRFLQEAKLLAQLDSPYVIRVLDYGTHPMTYFVMEYFEGKSLFDTIEDSGYIDQQRALNMFLQICDGLIAAHNLGLVHRDLKPDNILIREQGAAMQCKLVDFGLAKIMRLNPLDKLTATGEVLGSPAYMPPEQWKGTQLDHRADLYSLGCIMYEALAGERAFHIEPDEPPLNYLNKHLNCEPLPFAKIQPLLRQQISRSLERIICKCLQKKPVDRYSTAQELRDDLALLRDGKEPRAAKALLGAELRKIEQLFGAAALAFVLISALSFLLFSTRNRWLPPLLTAIDERVHFFQHSRDLPSAIETCRLELWLAQNLKPSHPRRLAALRSLSVLFKANNDPFDAANVDVQINQAIGKNFSPELSRALGQARRELFAKDDLPRAEQYGINALNIAAQNGRQSLGYAEAVGLMGRIYRSQRKRDLALTCALEALEITRQLLPDDDKAIARRLKNLGDAYLSLRRLPEAEKALGEAIRLNIEWNNESSVSADYSDLGLAYFEDAKVEDALRCLAKASSLETSTHSPEIPFRLAAIYLSQGRNNECVKACRRALELRKIAGTDQLPNARPIWARMVQAYLAMNDSKNAELCYKEGQKLVKTGETGASSPDPSDRD